MGLNKFCCRCDKIISRRDKYCEECQEEIDRKNKERFQIYLRHRKAMGKDKDTYKKYNSKREDKEYQEFYNSKEWKTKRDRIIAKFKYMDIYSYYKNKEIVSATLIHHINEVKEDYSKRLDEDNLITLCHSCHNILHGNYTEKEKQELYNIKNIYENEFL